jgi:hypothetical protein
MCELNVHHAKLGFIAITTAYVKDFIWKHLHLKTEFDHSSHPHMMKEDQRSHNLVLRKKSASLAFMY